MISCHCFLLMTSTRPPRIVTRLYNSQRSNTCLAIIGRRLMGVPRAKHSIRNMMATTEIPCIFIIRFSRIQDCCCCCCMGLPGWTSRQSDTTWTVKSQLENSYYLIILFLTQTMTKLNSKRKSESKRYSLLQIWIQLPQARHCNPRFVYFLPSFYIEERFKLQTIYVLNTEIFHFLSAVNTREWLLIKSGLQWRAYCNLIFSFISNLKQMHIFWQLLLEYGFFI